MVVRCALCREMGIMKLLRVGTAGAERPALLDAEGVLRDLSGIVADIDGTGQPSTAGGLNLLHSRMNRAGEFRMRGDGLGRDRDVGTVACGPKRDRQPDAATRARDKMSLAG